MRVVVNAKKNWQFSWSKGDFSSLDFIPKKFRRDDNRVFQFLEKHTCEAEVEKSYETMRIPSCKSRKPKRRGKTSSVRLPIMSKDRDEQLKLAHKMVDAVDISKTKNCVTLLRYNADKPEGSYAHIQLPVRKKGNRKIIELCRWIMNFMTFKSIHCIEFYK